MGTNYLYCQSISIQKKNVKMKVGTINCFENFSQERAQVLSYNHCPLRHSTKALMLIHRPFKSECVVN